jgi:YD repeat-containing protein
MGNWHLRCPGNLLQTDARGQRICLYYDTLSRLTGKHYRSDDACPGSPSYNVAYSYDYGPNGIGRRTGMTDTSGSTSWTYDSYGRVASEDRNFSGTHYVTTGRIIKQTFRRPCSTRMVKS